MFIKNISQYFKHSFQVYYLNIKIYMLNYKNKFKRKKMSNNFFPLTAEELFNRINKIPKVKFAVLPTPLEFLPNISKELEINLRINFN